MVCGCHLWFGKQKRNGRERKLWPTEWYVVNLNKMPKESKCTVSYKEMSNPLSPKSDQHQIPPCNISALKTRVVMRITNMITQDEFP